MLARRKAPAADAIDEDLDPSASCPSHSRIWFAAPSSPKGAGTGPCTEKAESAKASRSCASVPCHSWLRCGIVIRLATVRWQRPSALSGAGETVAAFAAHIDEADQDRKSTRQNSSQ